MAEINTATGNRRKKSLTPVQKKKLVRVDLTPMVDLGFLLITFFMFATTLAQPRAMKLVTPKDHAQNPVKVAQEKGLVLILGDKDRIFSYEAMNPVQSFRTDHFSDIARFRGMLADKKARTRLAIPNDPALIISLKCTEEATYGNFVNLLDELQINRAGIAIIDKPDNSEKELIAQAGL